MPPKKRKKLYDPEARSLLEKGLKDCVEKALESKGARGRPLLQLNEQICTRDLISHQKLLEAMMEHNNGGDVWRNMPLVRQLLVDIDDWHENKVITNFF